MNKYYRKWRLCLNDEKTEVSIFHLDNHSASRELDVYLNGGRLNHNRTPTYLGLPLDRSLTFKPALEQKAKKLCARNNLIRKLVGTNWGANGNVLRTSALSLVYSTAEYAAPVWYKSAHTNKVDVELNIAMRTITGAVDSTPLPWLHVNSNIAPPQLRRSLAAHNQWKKCFDDSRSYELPIKQELEHPPPPRLVSRSPIWSDTEIKSPSYDVHGKWKKFWDESPIFSNKFLIENPHEKLAGYNLPRREWKILNRFRSGHGCCGEQLHKWNFRDSPNCDCNVDTVQSMNHILNDCPLRKFDGGMRALNEASPEAIDWLRHLDINV